MRIAVAVVALGGLLIWEAWSERARHRIALLLERLPELLVLITVDLTAWQLAMVKAAEQTAEAARHLEHWRARSADASWVDSYSGQGEELERLEQVIEEQRERIGEIR